MSKKNTARDVLWPTDPDILVRVVFLYVGQGSSILLLVADGSTYKSALMDINLDASNGGIDIPRLLADLLGADGLGIFVNSHPHDDHLRGVVELSDAVNIQEVWHSGHKPGKKYEATYKDLKKVIEKVKKAGGTETILQGSREPKVIGEAEYYVLAPAEYVSDEVAEEDPNARYERIHEQCAVLKVGTQSTWVLLPGDADRDAFEKHITRYHKERLGAVVLAAPHHGSRSFFKNSEEDEPYLDGLKAIAPEYVVISAPKSSESQHEHPHDDALALYAAEVGEDNVLHTGAKRYCFICDIFRDGSYGGVEDDRGLLAEQYPIGTDGDGDKGSGGSTKEGYGAPAFVPRTRIDDRPMGGC